MRCETGTVLGRRSCLSSAVELRVTICVLLLFGGQAGRTAGYKAGWRCGMTIAAAKGGIIVVCISVSTRIAHDATPW